MGGVVKSVFSCAKNNVKICLQEIPIRPSNSSGLSVLLLLLPFNFFVIPLLTALFLRGRFCSRFRASSASACARSSFCWTVRVGEEGPGWVC